jgi:hypothetical protein
MFVDSEVLCTRVLTEQQERAVTDGGTRPEELYYDEEESICTQIIRTDICGASGINLVNNQLFS